MRIAYITTGFSPDEKEGYGSNAIHYFIKEISLRDKIESVVFSLYYPLKKRKYGFYNTLVYSYGRKLNNSKVSKLFSWAGLRRQFAEEHCRKPFDLIHSFWCGESGYVSVQLGKKYQIPVIASVCGGEVADIPEIDYGSQRRIFQRYFVKKTFESAVKINSLSKYVSNIISRNFPREFSDKVITLPLGVDENLFKPMGIKKKSDETKLISITNAVPVKAHNILLKAFSKAVERNGKLRLEIYGLGCPDKLGNLVSELELDFYVRLFPFAEHVKIPMMMNNADIYVLSSLYEAQNISLVEAAFCGLPVISSDVGCAGEITENTVPPGDFISFFEKIIHVSENLEDEKEKAFNRRYELLGKFSVKNVTDRFLELYNSII